MHTYNLGFAVAVVGAFGWTAEARAAACAQCLIRRRTKGWREGVGASEQAIVPDSPRGTGYLRACWPKAVAVYMYGLFLLMHNLQAVTHEWHHCPRPTRRSYFWPSP